MRKVVALAVICNNKLLLVQKKDVWILPGGKPEIGESNMEALIREVSEEIPGLQFYLTRLDFLACFQAKAPHQGDIIEVNVYLTVLDFEAGEGLVQLTPAAEITALCWTFQPSQCLLVEATKKAVCLLQSRGYLL